MRAPRDISGRELAALLRRLYGYTPHRQRGSHMRLVSSQMGTPHHLTVPRNDPLPVGTLDGILRDVSNYLEIRKDDLIQELFGS